MYETGLTDEAVIEGHDLIDRAEHEQEDQEVKSSPTSFHRWIDLTTCKSSHRSEQVGGPPSRMPDPGEASPAAPMPGQNPNVEAPKQKTSTMDKIKDTLSMKK